MDYWEVLTECMVKCWVVKLGSNPCSDDEACCVTLVNWKTGSFWSVFGPNWDGVFEKTRERVRQEA